jgi:hypothetical protein
MYQVVPQDKHRKQETFVCYKRCAIYEVAPSMTIPIIYHQPIRPYSFNDGHAPTAYICARFAKSNSGSWLRGTLPDVTSRANVAHSARLAVSGRVTCATSGSLFGIGSSRRSAHGVGSDSSSRWIRAEVPRTSHIVPYKYNLRQSCHQTREILRSGPRRRTAPMPSQNGKSPIRAHISRSV